MPAIVILAARAVFEAQREEFLQTRRGADALTYKPFDLDETGVCSDTRPPLRRFSSIASLP